MDLFHIDYETYSEANLPKTGAQRYVEHPGTEIICLGFAFNSAPPKLWLPGMGTSYFKKRAAQAARGEIRFVAWNSLFELPVWNLLFCPDAPLRPEWFIDTMAKSQSLALPRSLDQTCEALNVPDKYKKDKRGRDLINKLCKPQKGKRLRDEALEAELHAYCLQDVIAERYVHNLLNKY